MNHFWIGLWCAAKSGLYMTTSNDQLNGWTENKSQSSSLSHTYTKKMSGSLFSGGLLVVWSTTALWILAKLLYLRIILSKFLRCTENCNACSQHWSTEWAQFFPTAMPDRTSHNQGFRTWTNWVTKFCLILYIHLTAHQLTNTSSSILTTFCRKNASTPAGCSKMLSKNFIWSQSLVFMP